MKIAIYPVAFKPPHKGHFQVVKKLVDRDDISEVVVVVSSKERGGVSLEQSLNIWELYTNILGPKVKVIPAEGSPVYYTLSIIKNNSDQDFVVAFGKEESSRFASLANNPKVEIFDAGNFENISATDFRDAIRARNIKQVAKFLPDGVSTREFFDAFTRTYDKNKNSLNEHPIYEDKFPLLKEFVGYCREYLKLKSLPPLTMSYDPTTAESRRSFGGYDPNNKSIELSVANRHQADVFRTLAHELVHFKQDIQNRLTPESGKTGHAHENEANAAAAIIMRNFAQMRPEMFIVK
jgi:ribosomal protein S17E